MKYFLLSFYSLIFSLIVNSASAQPSLPNLNERQKAGYEKMIKNIEHPPAYYTLSEGNKWRYDLGMHKAKSLKTKSWVLVAAGAALTGAGVLVPSNGSDYTKPAFFVVGLGAVGTGIICFSVAKKRKTQAQLILSSPPSPGGTTSFFRPQAGFKLAL